MKILLVDDDQDLLLITKVIMERTAGFHVLQATTGVEALKIARREGPDVVLMDVMMPDMDGLELLVKFRQEATLKDIPVIFLTGKTDPAQVIRLGEFGAQGVIQKPFQPLELADKLMAILEAGET